MPSRYELGFQPIHGTTAPGFNATFDSTSVAVAIASTLRVFQGPGSRVLRVASIAGDDFYLALGSSTVVASSTGISVLVLGAAVSFFPIQPSQTYVAVISSTTVTVNFTPGYGR